MYNNCIYRDNKTKQLICTFAFAVDELKMVHYYNVLSGGGEPHNAMCWVLGKAISDNIWYRTHWIDYTDKPEFSVKNMNFVVGSDTADKDYLMGPRLYNQVAEYLKLSQFMSPSSCILKNHYKHVIDLKLFAVSATFVLFLYNFYIIFI